MLQFTQMDVYDEAKKILLYGEKISTRSIQPGDEKLDHKIRSSLITLVASIARSSALESSAAYRSSVAESSALLHEIAAGYDIARDKSLIDDAMFNKLKDKIEHLLLVLQSSTRSVSS